MSDIEKSPDLNKFTFAVADVTNPDYSASIDKDTFLSLRPVELIRVSATGLWVNPDIPTDECAQRMLEVLRPFIQHTIDAEVERLKAENARLRAALAPLAALSLYPDDLGYLAALIRKDDDWDEQENDDTRTDVWVRRGDVRAARIALTGENDE